LIQSLYTTKLIATIGSTKKPQPWYMEITNHGLVDIFVGFVAGDTGYEQIVFWFYHYLEHTDGWPVRWIKILFLEQSRQRKGKTVKAMWGTERCCSNNFSPSYHIKTVQPFFGLNVIWPKNEWILFFLVPISMELDSS